MTFSVTVRGCLKHSTSRLPSATPCSSFLLSGEIVSFLMGVGRLGVATSGVAGRGTHAADYVVVEFEVGTVQRAAI